LVKIITLKTGGSCVAQGRLFHEIATAPPAQQKLAVGPRNDLREGKEFNGRPLLNGANATEAK
jgi:hypothetical protein